MKNPNEVGESSGGTIPETGSYIPESSLVPESEAFIPESHVADPDGGNGLPGGAAYGVKNAPAAKKAGLKQKIPFIVFGGIVFVVAGSFAAKTLKGSGQPQGSQAGFQVQVKPAPVETAASLPSVTPPSVTATPQVEPAPPVALGQVSAGEKLAGAANSPVASANSVPEAAGAKSLAKAETSPDSHETKMPQAQVITPTLASAKLSDHGVQPAAESKSPAALGSAGVSIAKPSSQIHDVPSTAKPAVKDSSAVSVKDGSDIGSPSAGSAKADIARADAFDGVKCEKPAAVNKVRNKAHLRSLASATRKHRAHKADSKGVEVPKVVAPVEAEGYALKVVKNGLAWVTKSGAPIVVRVGDEIQGLGKVTSVDDKGMRVVVGKYFIEQK